MQGGAMNPSRHVAVSHPSVAASLLFDVVVFAGGTASGLNPLCNSEPKPMLNICNRPMIWYCLRPWIDVGCRTYFVCVNEDYAALQSYLCREFPFVEFFFVLVPLIQNEVPTTTTDAVKAFLELKETLKPETAGDPRDALLLSCDTFIPGVNLEAFISHFYSSLASVSVALFRPNAETVHLQQKMVQLQQAESGAGGKKGARPQIAQVMKPYAHELVCVAYEEDASEHVGRSSDLGPSSARGCVGHSAGNRSTAGIASQVPAPTTGGDGVDGLNGAVLPCHHHRLHFICPLEDNPTPRISAGFAFRRPNMTFSADVADVHVYLVRQWVLDYISNAAGQGTTVRRDLIPLLARSQHATVNSAEDVFITPGQKISHTIPDHWTMAGSNMSSLNATPLLHMPEPQDTLRVFCTIYEESPDYPMRMYRATTRDAYLAINHELLLGKCTQYNVSAFDTPGKGVPSHSAAVTASVRGSRGHDAGRGRGSTSKKGDAGSPHAAVSGAMVPTLSCLALCDLLPEVPISVDLKDEVQRVVIWGSLMRSIPPKNAFISRSVIGNNVSLGRNARVTNSVILDNVEIADDCVIVNSVVGTSSIINASVKVVNATVGPQCTVDSDEVDTMVQV